MILAAGLGTRMRPLTLERPKPLIEVGGRALIDHAADRLAQHAIRRLVVNKHYLGEMIDAWAARQDRFEVLVSDETAQLLETGGGIVRALEFLNSDPFIVLNSDSFWLDGPVPALARLAQAFRATDMDCLLLLAEKPASIGFDGPGDFYCDDHGRLERRGDRTAAPYVYAGCYLVSPALFEAAPEGPFSMNVLWNRAIENGRLFGLVHDGLWLHVGTPDAIALAESAMQDF